LKKKIKLFGTVSSRLALWYAVLFTTASIVSFIAIYVLLSTSLTEREDNELTAELREFELVYNSNRLEFLDSVIKNEAASEGVNQVFIRVTSPEHGILASSDMNNWKDIPVRPGIDVERGGVHFESFSSKDHPDGVRMAHQTMKDGNVITIGMNRVDDKAFLNTFIEVSLTVMTLAVVVGTLTGWFISRKAMRGFERVRITASNIGKGDTSSRVPIGQEGEEIKNLAITFNSMLDRIESLISELKDVTNNIAHELRSPLTRMRGAAETALTKTTSIQDFQEMAALVMEEGDGLSTIINTMLEIAETDAGVIHLVREKVHLNGLIRKAHDIFLVVAEDKGITFSLDLPSSDIFIEGDTVRMQRCVSNLLDNALKFTPSGGRILIALRELPDHVEISVTDTGTGIEETDLPHIFEKFYRSDKSRSTTGNGLGLSLVQSFVRAHNGEIFVKSRPMGGTTFTVILHKIS